MENETKILIQKRVSYDITLDVIFSHWDKVKELLEQNGLKIDQFVNYIKESEGGSANQASFGDHVLHKLMKAACIFEWGDMTDEKKKPSFDSVIGDLIQAKDYAATRAPKDRDYTECVGLE